MMYVSHFKHLLLISPIALYRAAINQFTFEISRGMFLIQEAL